MLVYPIDITDNESIKNYFPNFYNFTLNKIKHKYEGKIVKQKQVKELQDFYFSILLDEFIKFCNDNVDCFNLINNIQSCLIDEVNNNADFYRFSNGCVLAKNMNYSKIKHLFNTIIRQIINNVLTTLQNLPNNDLIKIYYLTDEVSTDSNEDTKYVDYIENSLINLFADFINSFNSNLNGNMSSEDLINFTLQQNLELEFANCFIKTLKQHINNYNIVCMMI